MPTTLRDVAQRAGVSVRTVSNVVNDFPQVSDATRALVQKAIDELDYQPNLVARRLRTGRTGVLGLLVPKLSQPYFAELADAMVTAAGRRGRTLVIDQTDGRRDSERSPFAQAAADQLWEGAVVSPLALTREDLDPRRRAMPLVMLGEHAEALDIAWVGCDNLAAAKSAVDHLISLGRKEIAVIGHQSGPGGETGQVRTKGYRAAMRSAGLPVRRGWIRTPTSFDRAGGADAVRTLMTLSSRPDAIFCYNDELALGALFALHQLGVRVPDDVAVMGWDDIVESSFAVPTLTSVAVPKTAVADAALDQLLHQIEHGVTSREHVVIEHQIAVRASTAGSTPDSHPLDAHGGTSGV
ncbi:LacI family DNA-binding transcriptional regulator [Luteipulveratus mongoliensis]|uniref:HTH lacI-type domain-containing protein n=1 Tax=Luteipulveratus mongoliensis TaxID=571913 RepID=A0A0K1JLE2_9MICO|nr:LacI family DNA-binding transcriptional regulator [Luteipulveratus mongoliensis]AKU17544.1 hypothetical protein VV02_19690 [Luteipulveratus mongoliensis]